MMKSNAYRVSVAYISGAVHIHTAYSFQMECWPNVFITERLKDVRSKRKKRLFSCEIYRDKTCVYRYNIIAAQDWKVALKRALARPCKKFSVFMELTDRSGIYITAERKS